MLNDDKSVQKLRETAEAEFFNRYKRTPKSKQVTSQARKLLQSVQLDEEQVASLERDLTAMLGNHIADVQHNLGKTIADVLKEHREVKVVVQKPDEPLEVVDGLVHELWPTLRKACEARGNIWITGPMGGGKSTAAKQAADSMGLPFSYIPQVNMPHQVVGHVDGVDKSHFHHTAFTRAFKHGGVCVLEEIDSWHPNATLAANAPLANNYIQLENGEFIERHPDCVILACANTWGRGATAEYVGRNRLDAAFLDRFGIKLDWQYDEELERRAVDNNEIVNAVQQARRNAEHYGLKIAISPRSSFQIKSLVEVGFDLREAMQMNFLSGLDDAAQRKLLEDVDL